MTEEDRIREIYHRVSEAAEHWPTTTLDYYHGQPFKALIAGMLSAQSREEQTLKAAETLFALADNPEDILKLTDRQILEAVRPATYYESKAKYVREICQRLVEIDGGVVPSELDKLVQYRGVGWKVAVLTRQVAFDIHDDITVDVHVNRISKRLGLVDPSIKQPEKINEALKQVMPREFWARWNSMMVQFGREVCKPTYPQCATCFLRELCPQIGVVQTGPRTFKNAEYK
ncbi:MAG: endonuclease III [Anaerolineaceae bacterium]|nr:endonuclease III [Anaerolineaceae bacterium]